MTPSLEHLLPALALLSVLGATERAESTPLYAVRSANACDTCHIEPLGWANPPLADRLCTMDCQGCHVVPNGGGVRTPSGEFYGKEILPTWGARPSASANPEKYRPKGFPKKGTYNLADGFSGWWAGKVPMQDIPERYGDIDADPTWNWAFDSRDAVFVPLEKGDRSVAFVPMQARLAATARFVDHLVLHAMVSPIPDDDPETDTPAIDLPETFIKIDRLPYNSHVRVGRFMPPFGWRLPDHTSYIRRDLGFDYSRQSFGAEVGYNPNYFIVQAAAFVEGLDFWPTDYADSGYGTSFLAGWRDLGWHLLANGMVQRNRDARYTDVIGGLSGALNLYPLVYMAELDLRRRGPDEGEARIDYFAYHELDLLVARGTDLYLKHDWTTSRALPELVERDITASDTANRNRLSAGSRWNPYTHIQLEGQYRVNLDAADFTEHEVLAMFRFWF